MTEPKAAGFQFECTLCGDECFGVPLRVNRRHPYVVDDQCAKENIVPLLLAAKANEFSYPPLWGNVVIEHKPFLHLLPDDFAQRYNEQRWEYRTPLALRIYCPNKLEKKSDGPKEQCGAFVGEKVNGLAQGPNNNIKWFKCRICSTRCCKECGADMVSEDLRKTVIHRCAAPANDDTSAFDGLIQGVHYQICPGCGMKVESAEACNALRCLGHPCRSRLGPLAVRQAMSTVEQANGRKCWLRSCARPSRATSDSGVGCRRAIDEHRDGGLATETLERFACP
jgi:hypothetical protein